MSATFDVIAFGDYFIDLVFTGLPRLPELGQEIYATGFAMLPGGAYNTVVNLHRLGARVGWACDFGNDEFSQFVLARARAEGLDERLFVHHRQPLRRITLVASFPSDRAFFSYTDPDPQIPAQLKALVKASARAVYLPGLYAGGQFEAGLALVRAKKMKLIMDGNSMTETLAGNPEVKRAISSVDIFMPNAMEARRLTGADHLGQALDALAELCPLVVIKDGANGALAAAGTTRCHAPAIAVTPIETTGAGDAFNAGFLRAWLDGHPLTECLRWGNIVGGLSTQGMGGSGQVITLKEVNEWLSRSKA
jgi:sugar/nucleoside kinase (ribokinase family)